MPASPSGGAEAGNCADVEVLKTHSADVPESFGPAIPELFVNPHELTEIISPLPLVVFIGCNQGPPDEPPDSRQLGNHQLTAPSVVMSSAQYIKFGSSLYE